MLVLQYRNKKSIVRIDVYPLNYSYMSIVDIYLAV